MYQLHLERVSFPEFFCKDDINTNNHPKDPEVASLDYNTEIERTRLTRWRDIINYPVLFEYTFTQDERNIFEGAIKLGTITKRPSSLHKEELDKMVVRLENAMADIETPDSGWFFRFNGSSPKDGKRDFPLMSPHEIIEQVSTSWRAFRCLAVQDCTIYLLEYIPTWDQSRELRVFVHKGNVTAISPYSCYTLETPFTSMSDDQLTLIADSVVETIQEVLPQCIDSFGTDSFVCDIYINEDLRTRIIEFNSFGYWLASGSAMFHWLKDKDKIYNTSRDIYFRIYESD